MIRLNFVDKKNIRDFTLDELKKEMAELGEPVYRAGQVFEWIYQKGAAQFKDFTNLPKKMREELEELYAIGGLELEECLQSADGTKKFLFRLADGNAIETVLIPSGARNTVCLSTQVGCKFACSFCASGLRDFERNLAPSEITGQILFLRDQLNLHLTNFVFMGMGEPLDNFDNVWRAILIMNSPQGLEIAARRISVSTCGIVPGIERLKDSGIQINLSLSLHAARDELRSKIVPVNKKYPLERVLQACEEYVRTSGRMMTLEYVLIQDVNDSPEDAARLAGIAKRLRAKVNLIPCSPVAGFDCRTPGRKRLEDFLRKLEERKVRAMLRKSKGADIQAACGQLAGRALN